MNDNEVVIGGRYLWDVFGKGWIVRITGRSGDRWDAAEDATGLEIWDIGADRLIRVLADHPPLRPKPVVITREITPREQAEAERQYRESGLKPVTGAEYLVDTMVLTTMAGAKQPSLKSYPTFAVGTLLRRSPKGQRTDIHVHCTYRPLLASRVLNHLKKLYLYERAYRSLADKQADVARLIRIASKKSMRGASSNAGESDGVTGSGACAA